MKNKILILGLLGLIALPAYSELTNESASSRDYLINHGHSKAVADLVECNKAVVVGGKCVMSTDNTEKILPVRWLDTLFNYFDPGRDDTDLMHHDIKFKPSYEDL